MEPSSGSLHHALPTWAGWLPAMMFQIGGGSGRGSAVSRSLSLARLGYQILEASRAYHEGGAVVLVGWVSDERDVALPDVIVEFERDGAGACSARSTARGRVFADLEPGRYRATLRRDGFGPKASVLDVGAGRGPVRFRLLSDRLIGFMWPKWVKAGESSQHRFHAAEGYGLSLWRYGLEKTLVRQIGWIDEHGPGANLQLTPDGDYSQTGVDWSRVGYGDLPHLRDCVEAPSRSGLYYVHATSDSGAFFAAPWIVAPAEPSAPIAVLASANTWNAYNNFGGRSNYINAVGLPEEPVVNARQDLGRYRGEAAGEWAHPNAAYAPLSFERPEPFNHVPVETRVVDPIEGRQAVVDPRGRGGVDGHPERPGPLPRWT
jgi:hypothetical protein